MRPYWKWLPVIIWAGLMLWGTTAPQSALPIQDVEVVPRISLFHVASYGVLAFLIAWALSTAVRHRHLFAFAAAVAFGTLGEWLQTFSPDRHAELADWGASTVGALIGAVAYQIVTHFTRGPTIQ
jgi:VanZ family protein